MRCRRACPVHSRRARRDYARFIADTQAWAHIVWAHQLVVRQRLFDALDRQRA